jgi:TonB-dependent receptor
MSEWRRRIDRRKTGNGVPAARGVLAAWGVVAALGVLAASSQAGVAVAEERGGALSGHVTDSNGNALPGARVHFDARVLDATTDAAGRFSISGLPAGHLKVEISCVGFVTETREIDLAPGHSAQLDAKLQLDLHVSDSVTVTASRSHGEVEALNEQKSAQDIVTVLPADVITSLPNTNVADAVGRLPSVSLERDEGEGKYVQIRGTEPRLSNFEINGVHIPSPEASVRNIKLDIIPSDLVGTIELHKTLSADRDADAIGGSINLITKTPGDQPYWALGATGGVTDIQGHRYVYQGNGTYATRFGDERRAGVIVGGDYDWNGRGINDIEPSVGSVDLGQGPVPAFKAMDLRDYRYERSRSGYHAGFDYRLDASNAVYARALLADFRNYGDRWVASPAAGNFLTPTTTDDTGSISSSVQNRRPHEQIYSGSGGGDHVLGDMLVDYTLAYSHSQQNRLDELTTDFAGPSNVAYQVDASNPYFPRFIPINGVDINDPRLYTLSDFQIANERTASHDLAAALNLSIGHRMGDGDGVLKLGAKFRDERKRNQNADQFLTATGAPALTLDQALDPFADPGYYMNHYTLGPVPSLSAVANFVNTHPGAVADDPAQDHLRDDPNNFTAKEQIAAAYAMETLKLASATLEAGVRVEHTAADYTGFKVQNDANGNYVSTSPVAGSNNYTDVVPTVNLRYEITPRTNARLAYSHSLSRPNFSDLPPFFIRDDQGMTISVGNPDLKPTHAHNYDLLLEHYLPTVGYLSAGAFYKDLQDPIYTVDTPITSGPFAGYRQSQPINGPQASIYGFEAAWQQHLTFLPGVFQGLGVLANYTYTHSRATVPGRGDHPELVRTTPNEANLGLTYDRGPFSARVAMTYNAAYIFAYNFQPGADLGIHGPNGDLYLYPHTQLDAQAGYTFPMGLEVLVSLLNINNEVFGFYQGSSRYTIQREFYGTSYIVGFRLTR